MRVTLRYPRLTLVPPSPPTSGELACRPRYPISVIILIGFLDSGQCYILQLQSEELNVKKIITIVYATYFQLQKESLNRSQTFDLSDYYRCSTLKLMFELTSQLGTGYHSLIFLVIVGLQDLPCVVKWFWPETKPDKEESEEEKEKDGTEDADDDEEEEDEPEVCHKKISVFFYYVIHCQEGLLSIFRLCYLANSVKVLHFSKTHTL